MVKPTEFCVDQSKLIKLATDLVKNIEDQYTANNLLRKLEQCGNDLSNKQHHTAIKDVAKEMLHRAVMFYDESINFHRDHTFVLEETEREPQIYHSGDVKQFNLKIANRVNIIQESLMSLRNGPVADEEAVKQLYMRMCSRLMFYGLHSLLKLQQEF